jgi:hypothetical protein
LRCQTEGFKCFVIVVLIDVGNPLKDVRASTRDLFEIRVIELLSYFVRLLKARDGLGEQRRVRVLPPI